MYEDFIKFKICDSYPNGTNVYTDYKPWAYWKVLSEYWLSFRVLYNV